MLTQVLRDKDRLIAIALIIMCLLLAAVSLLSYHYANSISLDFHQKQDEFIAKLAEYKKRFDVLQITLNEKIKLLSESQEKIKELEVELKTVRKEGEKNRLELEEERRNLSAKIAALKEKLDRLENAPIEEVITEALSKETNSEVRAVIADSLARVELIRTGKAVSLEPILVTAAGAPEVAAVSPNARFSIITLDRKNNLIAINGGRRDGLKEGDRLSILKDGKPAATAGVIAVRYRVASAFVNNTRQNFSFRDIKEGDEVIIAEK
ncbi:MAG: hypothetical protein NC938_06615 [Candidatus Omnitrophica bacterium]|nr:hypothetical protein [Candidatus Omnitrophota bacterium]MCM8791349.1 hypothetical protein [Candidatus Omnitrophota bacterium]